MKVLITGGRGMLGSDTTNTLLGRGADAVSVDLDEADITDRNAIGTLVSSTSPQIIVHCAAYTMVDDCEKDREMAFRVNAEGTRNIAEAAEKLGASLIYISTDYIFDGTSSRPYAETDAPNPINVYGESKLEGERYVREICKGHYIVRTSWLFGRKGANFVDTMISMMKSGKKPLRVVNDQRGSPTYSIHLAGAIAKIIKSIEENERPPAGIYNITGSGDCTWYDFSRKIADILGYGHEIVPVTTKDFPRPAARPGYSILDKSLVFKVFGIKMPHWEAALKEYIDLKGL